MFFAYNSLLLLSLVAARPSTYRTMIVHESRQVAPAGFTLTKAAPSDTILNLRIALKESDPDGLKAALMDVSSPGSAKYGHHLSKEEVRPYQP
jgi:tripeptidyl-peptidase I